MDFLLLFAALPGHAFLWAAGINRLHSTGVSHRMGTRLAYVGIVMVCLIPPAFGLWFVLSDLSIVGLTGTRPIPRPGLAYLVLCWISAVVASVWMGWRGLARRPPSVVRNERSQLVRPMSGSPAGEEETHHFMVRLPGNESLELDVSERALEIARLPRALDGLRIAHLSDFHFTGRVPKAYFQEVVRHANRLQPDLVAVTGDVVDHTDYIPWISDTLGKLESRYGTYFVLGNHDLRADVAAIRRSLKDLGFVDLGGRWIEIRVDGQPIVLAGNELPWFSPPADFHDAPPSALHGGPPRIVLSHTPDQLRWARQRDVDLMLAGHTHGGQIRFPWIGPVLTPSRTGVKYASGVFYEPPTVMHVTRGISGEHPIRMNCPPEITRLVLHAGGEKP